MKLGISTYTFTWAIGVQGYMPEKPLSVFDLIGKAAAYKVDSLQIADNMPMHEFDSMQLNSIKKYADNMGISLEVGTRGLIMSNVLQYIEIAKILDSPFLRIVIDDKNFHPTTDEAILLIKELVPHFQRENIVLALENHDRFLAAEFKYILDSVGSTHLAICLDSVNSMGAGEGFREVASLLEPYTVNLHIKDFNIKRVFHNMGLEIFGTPAGKGMMNIPEIISRLTQYEKCVSATLELWTPLQITAQETISLEQEWADESIYYLKKIISKP